jgi:intraflagellar transport protein 122
LREPNADSVAWNTEMEDMLCFSGNGMLSIKTGNYPTHHQKLKGSVVGFNGAKIFCMHNLTMSPIDVPQSASLYRYLEDRNFDKSYQVACLGVTESDWRLLAMEALRQMKLGYARRAFIRVRDMRYIELLNQIEISRRGRSAKNKWKNAESKVAAGNILKKNSNDMYDIAAKMDAREKLPSQDQVFLGHILAYQSRFTDAARVFEKAGHIDLAIEMFLDLKRYDDAKNYASKGKGSSKHSVSDLMKKQAEWSKATADWRSAAQMYVDACEFMKAIELLCENHGVEPLMDIVHKLDGKKDTMELLRCAKYFANNNHHSKAKQVYLKMGAIEDLLRLHMKMYKWEEALALAEEHNGKFDHIVYLPYAEYLAGADRFDEAQAAYKKAGRPEESLKLLTALAECAQIERRFESAACYYRQLSQEHLRVAELLNEDNNDGASSSAMSPGSGGTISKEREKQAKVAVHRIQSEESVTLAGVYFAYALIHQYTEDPFTHLEGDVVFSACCYLMNTLTCKSFRKRSTALHMSGLDPPGISRVHILYALAQTCILENIQAYKLARWTIQQLQQQAVPSLWQNQIDRTIVKIQSKPFSDKEGLAVTCYRCLHTNPLVNNIGTGDCCVNCSSPFMRCNGTFDVLPLVEFKPAEGISRQQSIKLLSQLPGGVDDSSSTSSTDGNNRGSSKSNSPSRGHSNNNSRNFDDGDILGGVDSFDDGYYGGRRGNSGAGYGRGSYGRDNSNSNSSMSSRDTSSNNRSNNRGKEEAFSRQLMKFEPGKKYTMVTVDSKMLLEMSGEDCILVDSPMGNLSYVKNMLPDDTNITVCTGCGCFFRAMSFEFSYLRDGGCPFCKSNNTGKFNTLFFNMFFSVN